MAKKFEVKFTKEDYITFEDIKTLITTEYPEDRAKILYKSLVNHVIFAHKMEDRKSKDIQCALYIFDKERVLYKTVTENPKEIEKQLIKFTTKIIALSLKNITKKQKKKLEKKYKKYTRIAQNNFINGYMIQLEDLLSNEDIIFSDPNLNEIHFLNGYYDFRTGTFQKRTYGKHFIVNYLDRDYIPSSKETKKYILKLLSQIYTEKDDMDYVLQTLGIALTGLSCSKQTILFNLGKGSAGKSTIMEFASSALKNYFHQLKSNTFASSKESNVDKVLNEFLKNSCIRLAYLNEPNDGKMDASLFKKFADGHITTVSLYKDGSNDFYHHSKLCIISNDMPDIKIDTGTLRRIESFQYNTKFVDDEKDVDEEKHIFLKNTDIINDFKQSKEQQNAFFEILAEYGHDYMTKNKIYKQTENFTKTKDIIISLNDGTQDFIDRALTTTDDDKNDRIGKDDMYRYFKQLYPTSFVKQQHLFNDLKDKGFRYEAKYRIKGGNGIQGCYVGVKFRDDTKSFEHSIFGKDNNNNKDEYEDNDIYIKEIEALKKEIEELKQIKKKYEEEKTIKTIDVKPPVIIEQAKEENEDVIERGIKQVISKERKAKEKPKEKPKDKKKTKAEINISTDIDNNFMDDLMVINIK